MNGAIIYFSGTGNTEFAVKQFKKSFEEKGVNCSLADVAKKKIFEDNYDFLVFGSPIHAESFPDIYIDWIKKHIKYGRGRSVIIFSTQASLKGAGPDILGRLLTKRDFKVKVLEFIEMPNNYYIVAFDKPTREEIQYKKEAAKVRISDLVDIFLKDGTSIKKVSKNRIIFGKTAYKYFLNYSWDWAKKNLEVDMNVCVKCWKCIKGCPTKNISLKEEFEFKDKCISCQKCIHCCPVNAYRYNGKKVEQYKV